MRINEAARSYLTLAALLLAALLVAQLPAPAQSLAVEVADEAKEQAKQADSESGQQTTDRGDVMNLEGDVNVAADETVNGDVVAFGGTAHVHGTVNGNVVAVGGNVQLHGGAKVQGDAIAIGGTIVRESDAEVAGSKVQISAEWAPGLLETLRTRAREAIREAGPEGEEAHERRQDGEVVFGESLRVAKGEVVHGDAVVVGGSAEVRGKVTGDMVVLGGPLEVYGDIVGDAVCVGGGVRLLWGSRVRGDAVAVGGRVVKDENARVDGDVVNVRVRGAPGWLPRAGAPGGLAGVLVRSVAWWLVCSLGLLMVTVLVVLLIPGQIDIAATTMAKDPGRAVLYGLVGLLLVVPMLAVLVLFVLTWIAIPFYLAAVAALAIIGGVATNVVIGRRIARLWNWRTPSILGVAIVGSIVLRLVDLAWAVPVVQLVAVFVWLAVIVFGFGGALMTRFGTDPTGSWLMRRLSSRPAQPTVPPPSPGPAAPPP